MEFITIATEKRLAKVETDYTVESEIQLMKELYSKYLSLNGMYGAKIKDMKVWGGFVPQNAFGLSNCGIKGREAEAIVRGLAVRYPELIKYRGTHDLDYVSIRDFNKLVRLVSE